MFKQYKVIEGKSANAPSIEFQGFPKIARFMRRIIVTEKIDGTNGCIYIGKDGEFLVGSRSRWITPENDNFGFAAWAYANREELMKLGVGRHFGEWWGQGINRGYGLTEKRFSLFNVQRWHLAGKEPEQIATADPRIVRTQEELPACCGLVPILYQGMPYTFEIELCLGRLRDFGSRAAPGYRLPEGLVVFHTAGNVGFKQTIENDETPKG